MNSQRRVQQALRTPRSCEGRETVSSRPPLPDSRGTDVTVSRPLYEIQIRLPGAGRGTPTPDLLHGRGDDEHRSHALRRHVTSATPAQVMAMPTMLSAVGTTPNTAHSISTAMIGGK